MSHKSRDRHRQKRAEADRREKADEPRKPLWERRMEERALRDGWNLPARIKSTIVSRLVDVVERDEQLDEAGIAIVSDRYLISAAKTLVYADLGQQRLDFARQQHADRLYAEARTATEGAPGTGDPVDRELYDWYGGACPCDLPPGECKIHKRARPNQRPPEGDWTRWLLLAGRGFGKTRVGAEWVKELARTGRAQRIALVAPTAADIRDVMVEGESGIVTISPPDFKPLYEPSKRRLTWPNGVVATCFSADEPERLRGPQHAAAWVDEPAAWRYPQQAWDMLMFGLRLGENPQVCLTTTPRPIKLIKDLIADPKTITVKGSTYDNKTHLAPPFFTEIISRYEGTRLGEQEIHAQVLDVTEGAWFQSFSKPRHTSDSLDLVPGIPLRLAIDAGASRYTGAVFFQVRPSLKPGGFPRVVVLGDYLAVDVVSADNAAKILARSIELFGRGPDLVRLDPAADAKSSLGPVAFGEYARIFGTRITERWPSHQVADGLDQLELLLGRPDEDPHLVIHDRCLHTINAFQSYRRTERGGEFLDTPLDPQHPAEDLMDALRGGIRDAMPEGSRPSQSNLRTVHPTRLH